MKPQELRIGNFYKSVKFQQPVKLELSDLMELYYKCDGAELDSEIISTMLEPIKLTEEWLLKFGFKWNGVDTEMSLNNVYAVFHQIDWTIEIFYHTHNVKNIKYVHQLQNLYFALTNEELILKT